MANKIINFLKFLLFLVLLIAVWNYKLVLYGVQQLNGQLKIVCKSVPVAEVINDPDVKPETKEKLVLIEEIRRFAMDSLGLTNSDNYTTFYDQKEKPLMWVVTGCKPYSLEAKKWKFPFVGEVSYKGFFKEHRAKKEELLVKQQGYETDIYSPSAWSTLGYFTDPILSNILKRGSGRIAELIIHELTHATIYLESSVDFNENFATFIGELGALKFLEFKYGIESQEVIKYQNFLEDEELYSSYMMVSSKKLDSLYKSFTPSYSVKAKATLKYKLIAEIMLGIDKLNLHSPQRYRHDFKKSPLPNNTDFMAFLRYRKEQEKFKIVFEDIYHSNLKAFIADIVVKSKNEETLPF
ncbi:MAG TPA: aminopeptidase [Bacteroidia bacterium]|nr:aminopeptidase [Bacteroidia bacterium]